MLEIAIVEDEEGYRNILCEYLKKYEKSRPFPVLCKR